MSLPRLVSALAAFSLALVACEPAETATGTDTSSSSSSTDTATSNPATCDPVSDSCEPATAACDRPSRWLKVIPSTGQCPLPKVANWACVTASDLTDCTGVPNYLYEQPASEGLEYRVCAYQWLGKDDPLQGPDVPALVAECAVVAPAGTHPDDFLIPDATGRALARRVGGERERALVAFFDAGVRLGSPAAGKGPLGVTVIDSVRADSFDGHDPGVLGLGLSLHGRVMAGIIGSVACATKDTGVCGALGLTHEQVLLYEGRADDPVQRVESRPEGGVRAYVSDVAAAIIRTAKEPGVAPTSRLINLSLGWDSDTKPGAIWTKDYVDELTDPKNVKGFADSTVLARNALAYAACKGVMAIAAAGNAKGSAIPDELAYPARFQTEKVTCTEKDRPLVLAVGAVDAAGRPIATSRKPEPSLVAMGIGGVFNDHLKGDAEDCPYDAKDPERGATYAPERTECPIASRPLSGTSVAAAVATGIAARLWLHEPSISIDELRKRLFERGEYLDRPASSKPFGFPDDSVHMLTGLGVHDRTDVTELDRSHQAVTPDCDDPFWTCQSAGSVWAMADPTPGSPPCEHCLLDVFIEDDKITGITAHIYATQNWKDLAIHGVEVALDAGAQRYKPQGFKGPLQSGDGDAYPLSPAFPSDVRRASYLVTWEFAGRRRQERIAIPIRYLKK